MNRYYKYPHMELWDPRVWEKRLSPVVPLAQKIDRINKEYNRIPAKPEAERRTDGIFDGKVYSLTYPEVKERWEKEGLIYHCFSMSTSSWIAMITEDQVSRKGYDFPTDTLIVLLNADFSDPCWCMYTLERYEEYVEAAAKERFQILFIETDRNDTMNQYINVIQEAVTIFHLNYSRFYLDVSAVLNAGESVDWPVESLGDIEIPVVNISGKWQNKDSLIHKLIMNDAFCNLDYDREALIHSETGKDMAEAMALEMDYDDARDPALLDKWDSMGLRCDFHEKEGEQWIMFASKQAMEDAEKLPVVCIFQEVNRFDPHQAVTGIAYCYEYVKLAVQGCCLVLFFVLETKDDNDLLHEILKDAEAIYPMDSARIYLTGHSHDGRFALEYSRRHPMDLAGVATLGNEPGIIPARYTSGNFVVTDEELKSMTEYDMPLINISGYTEKNCHYPLHSQADRLMPGQRIYLDTFEKKAESWQRRLYACNCPMKSTEEIAATKDSEDYVIRKTGIPADQTAVLYLRGSENYIADVKNREGKDHLRLVALDNMPHTITPNMIDLSWSFLRRFARDKETGKIIELY